MAIKLYFPVRDFIAEVQKVLQDEVGVLYDPDTELLPELNNACASVVAADSQALVFNQPYQIKPFTLSIVAQGQNYAQGDIIILGGGTFTLPIQLVVAGVGAAGELNMVDVTDYGSYTEYPAIATQSGTIGSGSGGTFAILKCGARQELTPDGASLIDCRMNLGVDGQTFTDVITKVPKDSMDADLPTWPMDVCGVDGAPETIQHYMTDPDDPKRFYFWPTPNVMEQPWFVQLIWRSVPNDVGMNDAFPLPSLYWPAVKAYIISRVLQRRDKMQNDMGVQKLIADKRYEFEKALGLTAASTRATVPRDTVNKTGTV